MSGLTFIGLLILCCGALGVHSADVKEENDVLVLDKANFNEVINEKDTLLVEFYAPWCGHCKQLEPQYAAAAKLLKSQNIALAKVDATVESALASDYNVEGYPTMKIFKKSLPGESFDYEGPRDTDGIVKFMQKVAQPSWKPPYQLSGLKQLAESNITEALDKQSAWLVGFAQSETDRSLLDDVAQMLKRGREPKAVGLLTEPALAASYGLSASAAFGVIRRQQPKAVIFNYELTADNLQKFYRAHAADTQPAVPQFNKLADIDSVNDGVEALLIGHFTPGSEEEAFFVNFLQESGFMFERRLEGGKVGEQLAKQLQLAQDAIYVRKPTKLLAANEQQLVQFTAKPLSATQLKRFYDQSSLPLVGHYAWNTKETYRNAPQPVCLLFLTVAFSGEAKSATLMWHERFAKALQSFAGQVLFAMADDEQNEDEVKSFRLDDSSADINVGCYDAEKRRYAMPEMDSFDAGELQQFVRRLLAGELQQTLRSVTAKAGSTIVKQLTGDTFQPLVLDDSTKHTLLLMCDTSQQPCALSAQEFAAAASTCVQLYPSLQFAQLDTRFNDAPGKYFYPFNPLDAEMTQPLVLLGKIGQKPDPIKFERSAVSKDYILQFVKDNLSEGKTEL